MLSLETHTKKTPAKILGHLKSFFGRNGLGLKLVSDCADHLTFEGGGGYVTAWLCRENDRTRVDFETREWEIPVERFVQTLI
jgi:hypothetical protein